MEERLISAAVAVEGKSGTALARKIKTSIQTSEVPVATSMMRKTGAFIQHCTGDAVLVCVSFM
jgi:hypothetical protein